MSIYSSCFDLGGKNSCLSKFLLDQNDTKSRSGDCVVVEFDNSNDYAKYAFILLFNPSNNVCLYSDRFDLLDHVNLLVMIS